MSLQEGWIQGNLTQRSFSELLFSIWQAEKTGFLRIKSAEVEKILPFKKGQIAITLKSIPKEEFGAFLAEREVLESSSIQEGKDYALQNKCSLLKALHELSLLPLPRIWMLLEEYIKEDSLPLFDRSEGSYEFDSEFIPLDSQILFLVPTIPFILQGVRRMKNHELIKSRIPSEETQIQVLSPYFLKQIDLDPAEKYMLSMIKISKYLKNVYEISEVGKRESQKLIFTLYSIGIITFPKGKVEAVSPGGYAEIELGKILVVFNEKFSYVYKYISKKLGPVAFNLVEKCLEETKPHLSSFMQEIKLDREGRILMDSNLKKNIAFASEETKRSLIQDLNEILVAEVLAVKKNLGKNYESSLVDNLEKIGGEE